MGAIDFEQLNPNLAAGARNAVETCLAIQPGESVALIFDEPSREVATSLAYALAKREAKWTGYCVEDYAKRPLAGAPKEILAALELVNAGILCFQPQLGELTARREIVGVVERRRIRYAHMVSVTPQIMQEGMRADYAKVDRLSERLRDRMRAANVLKVSTKGGTSIQATFDSSLDWVKTSGLISPRYWSNLPAGEVFTTPARVDGTFVCDGTAGDHFNAKYGDLKETPLVLELEAGRLKAAHCERQDLEEEFWGYCHTDENSDRIGELAFGTNLGLSEMIGVLLQDEKLPGVHLAFGDPYGSQTHANWQSKTHVDVLTRNCDVWIDEDQVIKKGRYVLDLFGME
ncbi:MAG: aminopeptidase [Candidatus Acidiferrales bacterium]